MAITKPPVLPAWADAGDKVQPSNAELSVGWPVSSTPPSRQRFNWVLNYVANAVRYFSRRGMPDYDAAETYMIGDRIIGDDGKTYRSLIDNNTAQTPSASPTKWERWGFSLADFGSNAQTQLTTAFTTTGATGAFVLTPSPAIAAYAANQRFRVKFHAVGNGTDTLNVSALGIKGLKQYDSTGTKVAAVIAANQLVDIEFDGVDFVLLDQLPQVAGLTQTAADVRYGSSFLSVDGTVAANALTAVLNPCKLDFRAAALTNGTPNNRTVPAAISLVVPAGATLGTVAAQSARLVLLAIDNAGTVELAVSNLAGGLNLDETTLVTTTAISAAATAANVIYSNTARAGVPFRVVGFLDVTEAVAGTWAVAPTAKLGIGGQALAALNPVKAWCTFNGTLAGTNAPIAGNNVTSVTRNAAGDYTVNLAKATVDANYAVLGTSSRVSTDAYGDMILKNQSRTSTTTSVQVINKASTGTLEDSTFNSVTILGN